MKIAIYGKLRSGKTEATDILKKNLECEVLEFSKALNDVVNIMYPHNRLQKDRELLVSVGQHLRMLDENIWVNIVKNKIEETNKPNIIVAGVRQQNEYDMLKEKGFKFIKIESEVETRLERCLNNNDTFDKESFNSDLECTLDDFEYDYLVENNATLSVFEEDLKFVIRDILEEDFIKLTKEMRDKKWK